jgi:hypothetical protein
MNYTELVAQVQAYTEDVVPADVMATFVKQAEQRIYNTVQFPSLRKNSIGYLTEGSPYLATPTDFLSVFSLAVISPSGGYSYLIDKDVNYIREAFPSPLDRGVPRMYAIFGPTAVGSPAVPTTELSFILGPTPDAAYDVELHYYYYPETIVTAGTSWLGDNMDSVLLYGTLLEAAVYMKTEPDILAMYDARYKEALMLSKRLGDGLQRKDAYRSGQARVPVN